MMIGYYLDNTTLREEDRRPASADAVEAGNGRWKLCWRNDPANASAMILRVNARPEVHAVLRAQATYLGGTLQEVLNRLHERAVTRGALLREQQDEA